MRCGDVYTRSTALQTVNTTCRTCHWKGESHDLVVLVLDISPRITAADGARKTNNDAMTVIIDSQDIVRRCFVAMVCGGIHQAEFFEIPDRYHGNLPVTL